MSQTHLIPLRSGVLIKPLATQKESISGLILSTSVSNQGEVVEIGPEVKELKVGMTVRYDEKAVARIDDLLMCREADVYCIVE